MVVNQESYVSVVAEEEWSNVGFDISKAGERDEQEKGEDEIRGEKENRELKRTRGRLSKVSNMSCVCVCVCGIPPCRKVVGRTPLSCPHCHPFLSLCVEEPCSAGEGCD